MDDTANKKSKSIHALKSLENGGVVSRQGFEFQDTVAVSFCLDMLETPRLQEVWCETHDDITLIFADEPGKEKVEFVQVKSTDPGHYWSIASLCEKGKGNPNSILEKSLQQDRCFETVQFRMVTAVEVNDALKILKDPIGSPERNSQAANFTSLLNELAKSKAAGFKSENGNNYEFWANNTFWEVRWSTEAVQNTNEKRLAKITEAKGLTLSRSELEGLNKFLFALVQDAATSRNDEKKKLKRSVLDELFWQEVIRLHPKPQPQQDHLKEEPQKHQAQLVQSAILAIENNQPNQAALVKKFMRWVIDELEQVEVAYSNPNYPSQEADELLVRALDNTTELVVAFCEVAQTIAEMKSIESAKTLYKGFVPILEHYFDGTSQERVSGESLPELYMFIGHELFTCFAAFLIDNECWEIINVLLLQFLNVRNKQVDRVAPQPFTLISQHGSLWERRKAREKSRYYELHAYFLKQRHLKKPQQPANPIAKFVSFDQFRVADRFLFTWNQVNKSLSPNYAKISWRHWQSWSAYYYSDFPVEEPLEIFGPRANFKSLHDAFAFLSKPVDLVTGLGLEELVQNASQFFYSQYSQYPDNIRA